MNKDFDLKGNSFVFSNLLQEKYTNICIVQRLHLGRSPTMPVFQQ